MLNLNINNNFRELRQPLLEPEVEMEEIPNAAAGQQQVNVAPHGLPRPARGPIRNHIRYRELFNNLFCFRPFVGQGVRLNDFRPQPVVDIINNDDEIVRIPVDNGRCRHDHLGMCPHCEEDYKNELYNGFFREDDDGNQIREPYNVPRPNMNEPIYHRVRGVNGGFLLDNFENRTVLVSTKNFRVPYTIFYGIEQGNLCDEWFKYQPGLFYGLFFKEVELVSSVVSELKAFWLTKSYDKEQLNYKDSVHYCRHLLRDAYLDEKLFYDTMHYAPLLAYYEAYSEQKSTRSIVTENFISRNYLPFLFYFFAIFHWLCMGGVLEFYTPTLFCVLFYIAINCGFGGNLLNHYFVTHFAIQFLFMLISILTKLFSYFLLIHYFYLFSYSFELAMAVTFIFSYIIMGLLHSPTFLVVDNHVRNDNDGNPFLVLGWHQIRSVLSLSVVIVGLMMVFIYLWLSYFYSYPLVWLINYLYPILNRWMTRFSVNRRVVFIPPLL